MSCSVWIMNARSSDDGSVVVPNLVDMTVPDARRAGHDGGVVVTSADLDGPPLGELAGPGTWIVTAQRPIVGSRVERWSVVVIEFKKQLKVPRRLHYGST